MQVDAGGGIKELRLLLSNKSLIWFNDELHPPCVVCARRNILERMIAELFKM